MHTSILIGANGYLGKHLSIFLDKKGFKNLNFGIQPAGFEGISNYRQFDITSKASFYQLDPAVDFVLWFAGLTGTDDGFEKFQDFVAVNELGLLNLMDWMRATGSRARIILPSTRLVYKGRKNYALKEEDPKEAKTIYSLNKLAAENILWMYQNAFGIAYTIFRICVPYGNLFDGAYSYGTIGFFLDKAQKKEDIALYGDGSIRRTFTHVEDICTNIYNAILRDGSRNNVFNIGGENLSLLEAATLVASKFGVGITFMPWPGLALKLESGDTVFDDSKLCSLIKPAGKFDLQKWLAGL
jgi:UDP-glucose 4-epimerase